MIQLRLLLVLLLGVLPALRAADMERVIRDTQRTSTKHDSLTIVWWIPTEFWRVAFANNPNMTPQQAEQFTKMVDGYTLVAVVKGSIGPAGGFTGLKPEAVRELVTLKVADTDVLLAEPDSIPADVQNLVSMMKPMLGNMLGQFGKSMEFLVFPNAEGDARLDPKSKGEFTIGVGGERFRWKLPLGSFLPDKIDPETGDVFPGDYVYNPYTGRELVVRRGAE